jgi:hypothetical protein
MIQTSLEVRLDDEKKLVLCEIPESIFDEQDLGSLGSDHGLFIALEILAPKPSFDVLAKVPSYEAGTQLLDLFESLLLQSPQSSGHRVRSSHLRIVEGGIPV